MASTNLLTNNVSDPAVEVIGDATLFPEGVFAGAHIQVELASEEAGEYEMIAELFGHARHNIYVGGGGWIKATVVSAQATTSLSLVMNTA